MRNVLKLSLGIILGLNLLASASKAQSKPKAASGGSGSGMERIIGESFSVLSQDRLLRPMPTDRVPLAEALAKLKTSAHPIQNRANNRINPVIQFLSLNPPQTLAHLEQSFQRGASPQTAYSIRRMMQICTECHAANVKPNWASLQPNAGLTLIELADFYKFAGRPNDALLYYEKILTTKGTASSRPDIWERAATNIVTLGIESTGSPYTYVDVMSNLLQETVVSKPQRDLVAFWRTTGKNWGLEKNLPTRPNELLDHARMLIVNGDNANHGLPNSGLVFYSRAMHELRRVQAVGSTDQKTKAFLMAGELREKLPIPGVWLGAEDFYEACIRSTPHSSDATRCWSLLSSLSARDPRFNLEAETNQQLQTLLR